MGDMAEYLLNGDDDSETGEYLGEGDGYPRTSADMKREADMEENDLKAFGMYTKAMREERSERFVKSWLPKFQAIKNCMVVYDEKRYCFVIDFIGIPTIFLEYYPKANKVFNLTTKKWIKPGLKWLINTYLEPKKEESEVSALTLILRKKKKEEGEDSAG